MQTITNNQNYVYHKDIRRSTTALTDSNGDLSVGYTYLPFGETTTHPGNGTIPDNEICYTGAINDSETGLYYMNARYYDPHSANFISQDTYRGEKNPSLEVSTIIFRVKNR